jgi:hypothetical protein
MRREFDMSSEAKARVWTYSEIGHILGYGPNVGDVVPAAFVEANPTTLHAKEMRELLAQISDDLCPKDYKSHPCVMRLEDILSAILAAEAKRGKSG